VHGLTLSDYQPSEVRLLVVEDGSGMRVMWTDYWNPSDLPSNLY
jgi:hypothetical protein